MKKEYIVTLNDGVNYNQFWQEMETNTVGLPAVPDRIVEIVNNRSGSLRSCHYALTDDEADILKKDPRVADVELNPALRDDIQFIKNARQKSIFTKSPTNNSKGVNWGLLRCSYTTNIYGASTGPTGGRDTYFYHLDGTGVDIVISDSGLQVDHPEFFDKNNTTRVQQIDWYAVANAYLTSIGQPVYTNTQSANHYRDYDGHGTHVAGIAGGKIFGWAKESRIYSIKIAGLEGVGDSGTGISVTEAQDLVKLFHLSKPIDPVTGCRRPTIVNMSWGYIGSRGTITTGQWRGTNWSASDPLYDEELERRNSFGIETSIYSVPVRQTWLDNDIEELIAAGVIVCIAAGNSRFKADVPTGQDYNNYYVDNFGTRYYHRGSSPYTITPGGFMVGSISTQVFSLLDRAAISSIRGPAVGIWCPGESIISSCSNIHEGSSGPYQADSNFKQQVLSGTSMASPQIAGMCALYLQVNPTATPAEVWNFIVQNSQPRVAGADVDSYSAFQSLMGSPNRFAYMSFSADAGLVNKANINGKVTR